MSKKKKRRQPSKAKQRKHKARQKRLSATAKSPHKHDPIIVQQNPNAPLYPVLRKNANYRCCECGHSYWFYPGSVTPPNVLEDKVPNNCPQCTSLYVEWLNYETDFAPRAYIVNAE